MNSFAACIVASTVMLASCEHPYPYVASYTTRPDGSVCKNVQVDMLHQNVECGPPPYVPPDNEASGQLPSTPPSEPDTQENRPIQQPQMIDDRDQHSPYPPQGKPPPQPPMQESFPSPFAPTHKEENTSSQKEELPPPSRHRPRPKLSPESIFTPAQPHAKVLPEHPQTNAVTAPSVVKPAEPNIPNNAPPVSKLRQSSPTGPEY